MTDDDLPTDTVARVDADNPTGRLDTGTVGALLDETDGPTGHVDVGHRGWTDAVGLTVDLGTDTESMTVSVDLSPTAARELAAALTQRAAKVESHGETGQCPE